MPQRLSQKPVTTFIKGLITEAGELTFPENASVDELNCDLRRDGSRRRRPAVRYEDANVLSSFTIGDANIVNTGTWMNVGGQAGLEYVVVQVGPTLYFYNKAIAPHSANIVSGSVNLSAYEVSGSIGAANVKCQFTSILGALVVASEALETIYIERNNDTGVLTTTQIDFRIRDFEWQGDITTYDTEGSATPTDARKYDTMNVGWVGTKGAAALSTYTAAYTTAYPALTLPWYSGKDASGNFSKTEWEKIYAGSSLVGNGHFILDFFSKDRATASGLSIATETETSRFHTVETFGGRVFYAGLNSDKNGGVILFSRLAETLSDLGECLQRNDPTSEELSDLLDTDGGMIKIQDAVGIEKLYAIGSTLLVFAENGVWAINGVDGVFRASEYSVRKVTEVGILRDDVGVKSFVVAEGAPFWWSSYGIHTITFDQVSGNPQEQNLSLTTIQTYWDDIPADSKTKVISAYDKINRRIYWAWPDEGETVESKVNNFLLLDIPLQAFFPWRVEDSTGTTDCIVGMEYYSAFGAGLVPFDVVTTAGDDVVTTAGDDVIQNLTGTFATGTPSIILLVRDGATNKLTMAGFIGTDFLDWGDANYSSFAEAGYEFLGDMLLKKNVPYVTTYMRVTETGWTGSEVAGYTPVGESGMLVSSYWDFRSTASSTAQQAYRLKHVPVPDPDNLNSFNYPESVITTRLKLRGHGRSLKLRFDSEQGKDFILLGYSVLGGANGRF